LSRGEVGVQVIQDMAGAQIGILDDFFQTASAAISATLLPELISPVFYGDWQTTKKSRFEAALFVYFLAQILLRRQYGGSNAPQQVTKVRGPEGSRSLRHSMRRDAAEAFRRR
jgi:hypothetical protein